MPRGRPRLTPSNEVVKEKRRAYQRAYYKRKREMLSCYCSTCNSFFTTVEFNKHNISTYHRLRLFLIREDYHEKYNDLLKEFDIERPTRYLSWD